MPLAKIAALTTVLPVLARKVPKLLYRAKGTAARVAVLLPEEARRFPESIHEVTGPITLPSGAHQGILARPRHVGGVQLRSNRSSKQGRGHNAQIGVRSNRLAQSPTFTRVERAASPRATVRAGSPKRVTSLPPQDADRFDDELANGFPLARRASCAVAASWLSVSTASSLAWKSAGDVPLRPICAPSSLTQYCARSISDRRATVSSPGASVASAGGCSRPFRPSAHRPTAQEIGADTHAQENDEDRESYEQPRGRQGERTRYRCRSLGLTADSVAVGIKRTPRRHRDVRRSGIAT